jgi:hypothetical protein
MAKVAEETIKLLNLLGQCYNGFGEFNEDNEIKVDEDDDFIMNILNTEYS